MSESRCLECGMMVDADEYHPYGACLMFSASHNRQIVRDNLVAIMQRGAEQERAHNSRNRVCKDQGEQESVSETKFTPGPWYWWDENTGRPPKYDIAKLMSPTRFRNICSPYGGAGKFALGRTEEDVANAHLIAAAPDLYNALSVLADAAESRGIPVDAARTALSKARGETGE